MNSSTSLSLPVLLLQIPLALILALSSRTLWSSQQPLPRIELAIGLILGVGICFAIGNVALSYLPHYQHNRQRVTLITWLVVGIQAKPSADLLSNSLGGEQLAYGWRTAFIPVVWLASLASATHVLQSRSEFLNTFHELRQTEATLSELERNSHARLEAERRQLIDTVKLAVQPELQHIATEIRDSRFQDTIEGIRALLLQVDNYSIHTVRKLIDELYEATKNSQETTLRTPLVKRIPLLNWRRLTLDPRCTMWITLSVSVAATLPTPGFHRPITMAAQVVVLLMPVFILDFISKMKFLKHRTVPVVWVLIACLTVIAFRLSLPADSPLLVLRNPPPELAAVIALLYAVCVLLGSLNRYFVDSYVTATNQQLLVNARLVQSVQNIESARLAVRRNVARIMHGPIQGRISAIRLKLHVLSETSTDVETALSETDAANLLELLEQISLEIENLGSQNLAPTTTSLEDALHALARKWRGIMEMTFDVSQEVQVFLTHNNDLTHKLVDACSEATTNASRHGYATTVALTFHVDTVKDVLHMCAVDDGRGVQQTITPGIGLQDIEADGGHWQFEAHTSGAKLHVTFPLAFTTASPMKL